MNVTIDQDKWLQAVAQEDALPVGLLTASPEVIDPMTAAPVRAPTEVAKALELTFRVVPGASEDELASVTAHLMCRLSWREEELGGEGLEFDVDGSVFGPDRAVLRLVPSKREGAARRVAQLVDELNTESRRVADRTRQDAAGGIGSKIERNLKAPLPESALKQLEMAAVA
jgi:hypothetical protein